jgi:integrase
MRDVRKKDPQSPCPLKFCVTYNRQRVYYPAGHKMTVDEWERFEAADLKDFDYKTKLGHMKEIRDDLVGYFEEKLKPSINELKDDFSFDALNMALTGEIKDGNSVNAAFRERIEQLKTRNQIGNAGVYRTAFTALERFKYYKGLKGAERKLEFIERCIADKHKTAGREVLNLSAEIKFSELTPKFLSDCEEFWREIELSDNSIGMYMRTLRALVNNKEAGKPYLSGNRYPFGESGGKYLIPEGGRRSIALPIKTIWRIELFETEQPALTLARDVFVFMFYCNGLNFGDLCRLRYKDINPATGEIQFYRKKTIAKMKNQSPIFAPILPPMMEIITRHGNKDQGGYIFPFLNGIEPTARNEARIKGAISLALAPINTALKAIAAQLGITEDLTTSYTRNSYITHLVGEELTNPIVVKQMVGHSTKKDVTAGYVNLMPKKRREINSQLLNPEKNYCENLMNFNFKAI